jgi:hypothetical protein
MTLGEIKDMVMSQTNNDKDDVTEFLPSLLGYINEGYDRLVWAYARKHVSGDDQSACMPLSNNTDKPDLPEWAHPAIAHWAAWCIYRNGNPGKQSRGFQFRAAAEETAAQIRAGTGETKFVNCPR